MICIYAESHLCTLTLIFYSWICIPFLRTAQFILAISAFLLNPHQNAQIEEPPPSCDLNLIPVSRYRDLEFRRDAGDDEGEKCAICLTEFEGEDLVNRLGRCGHVFHVECMEKWLDRCQFTCPLCRCLVPSSPCKSVLPLH